MEGYKAKPPIGSDYLLLQAVRKKSAGFKERARSEAKPSASRKAGEGERLTWYYHYDSKDKKN